MAAPTTQVSIHYGHLCTVRVSKYEIVSVGSSTPILSITFHVQANKTRQYKIFNVRTIHDNTKTPHELVKLAWQALTGQATGTLTQMTPTGQQQLVMDHILEFVTTETSKLGLNLTLDVV